eukprot:TRINITY_DN25074_c0_g1_i1.p1 TRINITY_DN25074_c0_g1~~TRINITY_DN25074_c0_g1_i1.p1  ORF type:complete len:707 (+),score=221.82 TRINITY_DN25074_c0_g1_i1:212-2122(+)
MTPPGGVRPPMMMGPGGPFPSLARPPGPPPRLPGSQFPDRLLTVFVGSIDEDVPDEVVGQLLEMCGHVRKWERLKDADDRKNKAFGFCSFDSADGALRALRILSGYRLGAQTLLLRVDPKAGKFLESYQARQVEERRALGRGDVPPGDEGLTAEELEARRLEQEDCLTREQIALFLVQRDKAIQEARAHSQEGGEQKGRDPQGQLPPDDERFDVEEAVRLGVYTQDKAEVVASEIAKFRESERALEERRLKKLKELEDKDRLRREGMERLRQQKVEEGGEKDREREREREKEREVQSSVRYEENEKERERERQRRERDLEDLFQRRIRDWEAREIDVHRLRERETEREAARVKDCMQQQERCVKEQKLDGEEEEDNAAHGRNRSRHDHRDNKEQQSLFVERRKRDLHRERMEDEEDRRREEREIADRARKEEEERLRRLEEEARAAEEGPVRLSLGLKKRIIEQKRPNRPIFGAVEDEEDEYRPKKKKIIPIEYTEEEMRGAFPGWTKERIETALKSREEEEKRKQQEEIRRLVSKIPNTPEELFAYSVKWQVVDKGHIAEKLRPWVSKKMTEFLGEEEKELIDFILEKIKSHSDPTELVDDMKEILEGEAEAFVGRLWWMLVFETLRFEWEEASG